MQIKNITRCASLVATIGLAAQLASCGGGSAPTPHGTLRVELTNSDASTCGYKAVNISVDSVRAHQSASAVPGDSGWQPIDVTLVQAMQVDLLTLINSAPQDLVTITLPVGHYAQVRLWLEERSVLVAKPNSVVRAWPQEIALDISNATSISIPHEFNVPANGQVDLILDFDACASVVDKGNDMLQLVPVVTVRPAS